MIIDDNDVRLIAERIKARREQVGLSLQDLADRTGLSKSTLQRYETGYIQGLPISKVSRLAAALETTPAYLMGWEQKKEPAGKDELDAEILEIFNRLSDDKKKQARDFLLFLQGKSDNS